MSFLPSQILGIWARGLLAVAVIAGGLYLLGRWYEASHRWVPTVTLEASREPDRDRSRPLEPVSGHRVFRFALGANAETAYLAAGFALLSWATLGRLLLGGLTAVTGRRPAHPTRRGDDDPREERTGETREIARPGGRVLRTECYGPADAPPIVFTHGWGADSTAWYYAKKSLAGRYRLIVWDEPGLGLSRRPDDGDFRLEALAADLDAVLDLAGGRPAVLVGHSIGGMIILTHCKVFPGATTRRVAGLALVHTTYTNPVKTTRGAAILNVLERPLIVPLLYLTIGLWPLVWAMNWLSYWNGSARRSTAKSSFAGTETPGQLDFCTKFLPHARPDVLARGMLGMLAYDATDVLATIAVPTLVVTGDRDTTTKPEAGQLIADRVPGAELLTLSPARHMGLMEQHGEFTAALDHFAASCQSASAMIA